MRDLTRTRGLGQTTRSLIANSIKYGKALAGQYAGSAGAVGAVVGAASLARRFRKKPAVAGVYNKAGPSFNPGGAGGFKTRLKKRKLSKRSRLVAARQRKFRRKVLNATKYTMISDLQQDYLTSIQSAEGGSDGIIGFAGPYGKTKRHLITTGNLPGLVGWNIIESPEFHDLDEELKQQARGQMSLDVNDDGIEEIVGKFFDNVSAKQISVKRDIAFVLDCRNNSTTSAKVTFYLMRCSETTDKSAYEDLLSFYQAGSIDGSDPSLAMNAPQLSKNHNQYISTPRHGRKRLWRKEQEVSMLLNPGDCAKQRMSVSCVLPCIPEGGLGDYRYYKGQWSIIARIEGTLEVSAADPSKFGWTGAVVGCHYTRYMKTYVSRKEYDSVKRISVGTVEEISDGIVAGDSTVHNVIN